MLKVIILSIISLVSFVHLMAEDTKVTVPDGDFTVRINVLDPSGEPLSDPDETVRPPPLLRTIYFMARSDRAAELDEIKTFVELLGESRMSGSRRSSRPLSVENWSFFSVHLSRIHNDDSEYDTASGLALGLEFRGRSEDYPYKGRVWLYDISEDDLDEDRVLSVEMQLEDDPDLFPKDSGEITVRIRSSVTGEPISGLDFPYLRYQNNAERSTDVEGVITLALEDIDADLHLRSFTPRQSLPLQRGEAPRNESLQAIIPGEDVRAAVEQGAVVDVETMPALVVFRVWMKGENGRVPYPGPAQMGVRKKGGNSSLRDIVDIANGTGVMYSRLHRLPVPGPFYSLYDEFPEGKSVGNRRGMPVEEIECMLVTHFIVESWAMPVRLDATELPIPQDGEGPDGGPPYIIDMFVEPAEEVRNYELRVVDAESGEPIAEEWSVQWYSKHEAQDDWILERADDRVVRVANIPWEPISIVVDAPGYEREIVELGLAGVEDSAIRLQAKTYVTLSYSDDLPVNDGIIVYRNESGFVRVAQRIDWMQLDDNDPRVLVQWKSSMATAESAIAIVGNDAQQSMIALRPIDLGGNQRVFAMPEHDDPHSFSLRVRMAEAVAWPAWIVAIDRETGFPLYGMDFGVAENSAVGDDDYQADGDLVTPWLGRPLDIYVIHGEEPGAALVARVESFPDDGQLEIEVDLDDPDLTWDAEIDRTWFPR